MIKVRNIRILFVNILIVLIFTSCRIQGTLKGLVSDYKKTKSERPDLFQAELMNLESYCNTNSYQAASIRLVNGNEMKQCLANYEEAIVYRWSPYCKSEICYPLNIFQLELDKKGLELFVVAEYYDTQFMAREYQLDRPILGIDVEYYKSNLTSRYTSKFISDLTNGMLKRSDDRLIYFKNGDYIGTYRNLFEI